MSSKPGIKKIARRIQRKHRNVFSRSLKVLELQLWVNDIDSGPSLHLGKRGAWNLLRIQDLKDPKLDRLTSRRYSNKIMSKKNWYNGYNY